MKDTIIEYDGKYYSDTDLSEELDDLYGGDLFDIYWNERTAGTMHEATYYFTDDMETTYDTPEEMVEDIFCENIVSLEEVIGRIEHERNL